MGVQIRTAGVETTQLQVETKSGKHPPSAGESKGSKIAREIGTDYEMCRVRQHGQRVWRS